MNKLSYQPSKYELEIKRIAQILSKVDEYYFVFQHLNGTIINSGNYGLNEILETNIDDVRDIALMCDCQPVGETYVIECNCEDYYNEFEFKGIKQVDTIAKLIMAEMYEALKYGCENYMGSIEQVARKKGILPPLSNKPFVLKGNKHWWNAKCSDCNWQGSSEFLGGGGAIADTGDCNDPFCPNCGETDIDDLS